MVISTGPAARWIALLRENLNSNRGDSAGLIIYGVIAALAWLWFPYRGLIIVAAVLAAGGLLGVVCSVRRGRDWHQADVLTRQLWKAVKRIPSGYVLTDMVSGELITVERERGWLTLAVTDEPRTGVDAIVTRYPVGQYAAPNPPPLFRYHAALEDIPLARLPWRQRWGLMAFNLQTSGLELTAAELRGLIDQVARSVAVV